MGSVVRMFYGFADYLVAVKESVLCDIL